MPLPVKDILRNAGTARRRVHPPRPTPLDEVRQLPFQDDLMGTAILDVLGPGLDDASGAVHIRPGGSVNRLAWLVPLIVAIGIGVIAVVVVLK